MDDMCLVTKASISLKNTLSTVGLPDGYTFDQDPSIIVSNSFRLKVAKWTPLYKLGINYVSVTHDIYMNSVFIDKTKSFNFVDIYTSNILHPDYLTGHVPSIKLCSTDYPDMVISSLIKLRDYILTAH